MLYVTMHQAMVNYHIMKICNDAKFMRRKMILTILFEQFISGFIRYFDFLLLYNDLKCWSENIRFDRVINSAELFCFLFSTHNRAALLRDRPCSVLTISYLLNYIACLQIYLVKQYFT